MYDTMTTATMDRNVELKAWIRDWEDSFQRVARLSHASPTVLVQEDIFFKSPSGRLKLRTIDGINSELIYYERPDVASSKTSRYLRVMVPQSGPVRELLAKTNGIAGVVRKRRTLFLLGRTRVHLDQVEGLGNLLEIEVVLTPSDTEATGKEIAGRLMESLGVRQADLIHNAYIDLLQDREQSLRVSRWAAFWYRLMEMIRIKKNEPQGSLMSRTRRNLLSDH